MSKNKAKSKFIENPTSRRTTFTKRVRGVMKKTQELSVLCEVEVCTIIYGPHSSVPVVWPSSEEQVKRVINNFQGRSSLNQYKRQYDQDAFLKERVAKAEEKVARLQRRNRVLEMESLITDLLCRRKTLDQVQRTDLGDLLWVLEDKLKAIEHRQTQAKSLHPVVARDAVANEDEGSDLGGAGLSCADDDYEACDEVKQYFLISDAPTLTEMQIGCSSQNMYSI